MFAAASRGQLPSAMLSAWHRPAVAWTAQQWRAGTQLPSPLPPPCPTDQSQAQAQQQDQQDEGRPKQETVVLPQIDSRGRAVPGAFGREEAGAGLPGAGGASLLLLRGSAC